MYVCPRRERRSFRVPCDGKGDADKWIIMQDLADGGAAQSKR
jgi:hypothetical protein